MKNEFKIKSNILVTISFNKGKQALNTVTVSVSAMIAFPQKNLFFQLEILNCLCVRKETIT